MGKIDDRSEAARNTLEYIRSHSTNKWDEVPKKDFTWNQEYWEDSVTQTESCMAMLDCPCGTWVQVWGINANTNCANCGRQYRVEISRKLVCYTPIAIRYPEAAQEQQEQEGDANEV
jgi:hypothetical protein